LCVYTRAGIVTAVHGYESSLVVFGRPLSREPFGTGAVDGEVINSVYGDNVVFEALG